MLFMYCLFLIKVEKQRKWIFFGKTSFHENKLEPLFEEFGLKESFLCCKDVVKDTLKSGRGIWNALKKHVFGDHDLVKLGGALQKLLECVQATTMDVSLLSKSKRSIAEIRVD